MDPKDDAAPEFVPLTPESRELYQKLWAQIEQPMTTLPPIDFIGLKEGAVQWGGKLNLPAGILVKFRQRVAAAQSDQAVFDVMEQFARLGNAGAGGPPAPTPGVTPDAKKNAKMQARDLRNELLLKDLRRVAKALRKKTVTTAEYQLKGRSTASIIVWRFHGWNNALVAAGLEAPQRRKIPMRDLFENLDRVRKALRRQPLPCDMRRPPSKISKDTYYARFGEWARAMKAFEAWKRDGTLPKEKAVPRKPARAVSPRERYLVLKRDDYKCVVCGRSPATHPGTILEVDHDKARSRGGQTVYKNLRTLCKECNRGKGAL